MPAAFGIFRTKSKEECDLKTFKGKGRKFLAAALSLLMLVGLLPVSAFAAGSSVTVTFAYLYQSDGSQIMYQDNSEGGPLSYTQFKRVWTYIETRTAKERTYYRYVNGKKIKHVIHPVLGEVAPHNNKVIYSLDFDVHPHQLRHTYITNLSSASVDPKTVQYLAGHKNSKITMDIYAKVKYNQPDQLRDLINVALGQ